MDATSVGLNADFGYVILVTISAIIMSWRAGYQVMSARKKKSGDFIQIKRISFSIDNYFILFCSIRKCIARMTGLTATKGLTKTRKYLNVFIKEVYTNIISPCELKFIEIPQTI